MRSVFWFFLGGFVVWVWYRGRSGVLTAGDFSISYTAHGNDSAGEPSDARMDN